MKQDQENLKPDTQADFNKQVMQEIQKLKARQSMLASYTQERIKELENCIITNDAYIPEDFKQLSFPEELLNGK